MALTNREKEVIRRFLKHHNDYHGFSFDVTSWPDELDRADEAIDAIAKDGERYLGIELTLLQPFTGEKYDSEVFMKTIGQLDKKETLILPDFDVDLTVSVGAVPKGVDWSMVAPGVERWYLSVKSSIPVGRSAYEVPDLSISLRVEIDKQRSPGQGHFFVQRFMPAETVEGVMEQALKTKVPKLLAACVEARVLLLEKDSPARGRREIRAAITDLSAKYPEVNQVNEVWIIDTVALESEGYAASYLVWPDQQSGKFEMWRHSSDRP